MNIFLLLKDLNFLFLFGKKWQNMALHPSIAIVQQFQDGMQVHVQNAGNYSEPFPVTNWVKQGCVMVLKLFSMMFSAMLTDAIQDCDAGFPIKYRFNGKLFNLRGLQANIRV